MSIIDTLIKDPSDQDAINRFMQMRRSGRLSEAQIRYAQAIIDRPSIVADKTDTLAADFDTKWEAMKAEAKAGAERARAERTEQARGIEAGQTVSWNSKKQGDLVGEVLRVEGDTAWVLPGHTTHARPVPNEKLTVQS